MARKISIGVGIADVPFSGAGAFWRWIDLCEEGGIDSVWQSDRLIGAQPFLETLTAMAALAGRTRRLKFGMNVLSVAQRDPVLVAKQCATIDYLSDGRLLPAFGVGADRSPEWAAMGIDPKTRGARTDEALEIIGRLWREDSVDFEGAHYRLSGAAIAPRPVQAELPMWIGGSSRAAVRRTARFGTGWQGGIDTPETAARVIAEVKAALVLAGRAIDEDHYGIGFPFRFGGVDDHPEIAATMRAYAAYGGIDPVGYFAIGDAGAILAQLSRYIGAGVSKFILRPMGFGDRDMMVQTERLIADVLPLLPHLSDARSADL
jgi:probable F420-dependent oxidoreductase